METHTIDVNPTINKLFSSGASAGSGLAIDGARGLLYGGTGQNSIAPYDGYPDPALAPAGYVDRGDSIYAMDILTGHDGPRDADVLSPPVLYSACSRGACRDFVAGGSKGGLFRAIDRLTGQTI